ncbi:MAG TPA: DivIVA domain-containing protein [Solirubrobacteraceae bacterium]|jgi:DivIVA domain-containing protein|nr:DivIVA domain-containing protein [Solirubrobacteraceae bacterium]
MALDRQTIERRDFPIGRRGYEPEAVDEHLARVAQEVESLQRHAQRRSGASLAQAASEQVRAIVEAAEQSAAAIERDAESQAERIRTEAEREAERTETEAVERAREHVAKVSEQTALMLQRVDAMEAELGALIESLRTGANRLNADLTLLEGNMGDLYQAAGGRPAGAQAGAAPASEPVAEAPVPAAAPTGGAATSEPAIDDGGLQDEGPTADDQPGPPPVAPQPRRVTQPAATASEPPEPAAATGGDGGDVEGARLIALNMALNGQSREETDRYLAENFDLSDRQSLLDEVYESVGG